MHTEFFVLCYDKILLNFYIKSITYIFPFRQNKYLKIIYCVIARKKKYVL